MNRKKVAVLLVTAALGIGSVSCADPKAGQDKESKAVTAQTKQQSDTDINANDQDENDQTKSDQSKDDKDKNNNDSTGNGTEDQNKNDKDKHDQDKNDQDNEEDTSMSNSPASYFDNLKLSVLTKGSMM